VPDSCHLRWNPANLDSGDSDCNSAIIARIWQ